MLILHAPEMARRRGVGALAFRRVRKTSQNLPNLSKAIYIELRLRMRRYAKLQPGRAGSWNTATPRIQTTGNSGPALPADPGREEPARRPRPPPATPEMTGDGLLGVLYEPAAGGHGYGKDNKERASFTALGYNFLRRAIGWS